MSSSYPPEVAKRINEIANKNGGRLTPEMVIKDAKKKSSPLHDLFEWDVAKAAKQAWMERARSIIRSVRVEIRTTTKTVKAVGYVRDPQIASKDQGYVSLKTVAESPEDAEGVMAYELSRAAASMTRCLELSKALGLEAETEAALSQVICLRETVNRRRGVRTNSATATA